MTYAQQLRMLLHTSELLVQATGMPHFFARLSGKVYHPYNSYSSYCNQNTCIVQPSSRQNLDKLKLGATCLNSSRKLSRGEVREVRMAHSRVVGNQIKQCVTWLANISVAGIVIRLSRPLSSDTLSRIGNTVQTDTLRSKVNQLHQAHMQSALWTYHQMPVRPVYQMSWPMKKVARPFRFYWGKYIILNCVNYN